MIDIKDALDKAETEYCMSGDDSRLMEISELQSDWSIMTEEEREDWYTTRVEHKRFCAQDIIEFAIEHLSEDGYEDMYDFCIDDLQDEHVKELQAVLDKISESDSYYVYHRDEQINPESEMPNEDDR